MAQYLSIMTQRAADLSKALKYTSVTDLIWEHDPPTCGDDTMATGMSSGRNDRSHYSNNGKQSGNGCGLVMLAVILGMLGAMLFAAVGSAHAEALTVSYTFPHIGATRSMVVGQGGSVAISTVEAGRLTVSTKQAGTITIDAGQKYSNGLPVLYIVDSGKTANLAISTGNIYTISVDSTISVDLSLTALQGNEDNLINKVYAPMASR